GVAALLKALPEGAAAMAGRALEEAVDRSFALLDPAFAALAAHVPQGSDDDRVLLDKSLRAQTSWETAETACGALDGGLRAALAAAQEAAKTVRETGLMEDSDTLAGEIETAARKLDELARLLSGLMTRTDPDTIAWLGRERDATASLNSAPLEVGP